jgi:hypothetical protein
MNLLKTQQWKDITTLQTIDRGQSLAARRTHRSRSSLLRLLSSVTVRVSRIMIATQQVQKIISYEGHNNKDKVIVRLNAEKHLYLNSLIISTYLPVESGTTQTYLHVHLIKYKKLHKNYN